MKSKTHVQSRSETQGQSPSLCLFGSHEAIPQGSGALSMREEKSRRTEHLKTGPNKLKLKKSNLSHLTHSQDSWMNLRREVSACEQEF